MLSTEDVMEGVADMVSEVQVGSYFPGHKLVTVHNPIQPGRLYLGKGRCGE